MFAMSVNFDKSLLPLFQIRYVRERLIDVVQISGPCFSEQRRDVVCARCFDGFAAGAVIDDPQYLGSNT
jgi:hypothetical protein